jgi:hypothetical protein
MTVHPSGCTGLTAGKRVQALASAAVATTDDQRTNGPDMTDSAHFAEIYQRGTDMVIVISVTDHTARARKVVDGQAVPAGADFDIAHEELRSGWDLIHTLPRLVCTGARAAQEAADFLAGRGVRNVFVHNYVLAASMPVSSVMRLAEDALANGWAHDHECARMISEIC